MTDKDIFIQSFKNYLARRLLSEKSESIDYERSIVTKLKINCGRQVTDSIEGMMNDLELAKDQAKAYREHRQKAGEQGGEDPIEFDIKILTTSYWPSYKSFELSVPQEIKTCMDNFQTFYKNQQNNHHRELKWNFAMGNAVVHCKIPNNDKLYQFVVSTYQLCILYLFNYNTELTLEEIREHMGFDEETAKKNIQSMMQSKARLVIMQDGKYKVNMQYSNKHTRITFPVPVLEELVKRERVTQDRSNAVDAALVRIMKSRKKLGINQLKVEVITLMQTFKPDDALIKKRIENLIEREYLERDKTDQS